MPSVRITKELKDKVYFVTFTVHNWYYLFDRHHRFEILEDSFVFCQKNKGLKIYAFVFMLNHLHFSGSAPDMIAVIRDMKTYLAKNLKKNISETERNLLKLFEKDGEYRFWKETNFPKIIESQEFLHQKIEYIESNPVRKQYVLYPEDWRWSSASKVPTRIAVMNVEE
jgi:REP element-mobilizing transposase RayT